MTGDQVRELDNREIQAELLRLRNRLFQLRVQAATEKVEDNSEFGKVRKDIARLLTERTARQRAGRGAQPQAQAQSRAQAEAANA